MNDWEASFTLPLAYERAPEPTPNLTHIQLDDIRLKEVLGLFAADFPVPPHATIGDVVHEFRKLQEEVQQRYTTEGRKIAQGKIAFIEYLFIEKGKEDMNAEEIIKYGEREWARSDFPHRDSCIGAGAPSPKP